MMYLYNSDIPVYEKRPGRKHGNHCDTEIPPLHMRQAERWHYDSANEFSIIDMAEIRQKKLSAGMNQSSGYGYLGWYTSW